MKMTQNAMVVVQAPVTSARYLLSLCRVNAQ